MMLAGGVSVSRLARRGIMRSAAAILRHPSNLGHELGRPGGIGRLGPEERLSRRQLEVARLVADGLTNREVATTLWISVRTVETHLRLIYLKLGVTSRAQLAMRIRTAELG
jgi:DNA-binding NarL/FixJ family response regulator